MKYILGSLTIIGASLLAANPAYAQTQNGQELIGNSVDVQFADGVRNIVAFGPSGQARITSADGTLSNASWFVRDNQLCLQTGSVSECWGYSQRFVAGRAFIMASSCNMTSQWTARAVNPLPAPVRPAEPSERG